ncbi:MAG: hypothetical protein R3Y10_10150 [Ferrimonas sp.]
MLLSQVARHTEDGKLVLSGNETAHTERWGVLLAHNMRRYVLSMGFRFASDLTEGSA